MWLLCCCEWVKVRHTHSTVVAAAGCFFFYNDFYALRNLPSKKRSSLISTSSSTFIYLFTTYMNEVLLLVREWMW